MNFAGIKSYHYELQTIRMVLPYCSIRYVYLKDITFCLSQLFYNRTQSQKVYKFYMSIIYGADMV